MKMIRLATIAVLTSTILAGGIQAFADDDVKEIRETTTENTVTFTGDGDEDVVVQPPVEEPDVDLGPNPSPQKGPLTIAYAPSVFDFGSNPISTQDQAYSMIAEEQTVTGTQDKVPYVSFIQVQDTRGDKDSGWNLTVSLSPFVSATDPNDELTGAEIEFINAKKRFNDDKGDQTLAPTVNGEGSSLIVKSNNFGVPIMTAAAGHGRGSSSTIWGDQDELTADFNNDELDGPVRNHAIKLHIPGTTMPEANVAYQATMEWILSDTADSGGEYIPEE